jgi:hypothetical protein
MKGFPKTLWGRVQTRAAVIGGVFLVLGALVLLLEFVLVLGNWSRADIGLFRISLGLVSVGLGLIAMSMAQKSDKRHMELLERLDKSTTSLPVLAKGDTPTPSGQLLAEEPVGEQSKIAAQRRLDEDTKRVGVVRGELYQLEDGSWAIRWGGKYPL